MNRTTNQASSRVQRTDPPRPATLASAPTCSSCGAALALGHDCTRCAARQRVARMNGPVAATTPRVVL